MNSSKNS